MSHETRKKTANDAIAANQSATQMLAAKQQAAKATTDALPPLKANLDKAAADLNVAKGATEQLQAAVAAVPAKK